MLCQYVAHLVDCGNDIGPVGCSFIGKAGRTERVIDVMPFGVGFGFMGITDLIGPNAGLHEDELAERKGRPCMFEFRFPGLEIGMAFENDIDGGALARR